MRINQPDNAATESLAPGPGFLIIDELVLSNKEIAIKQETVLTLEQMPPGACGKVCGLTAAGNLGQRLMDLGFFPGIEFRVIRNAPLLDPLEIEMMGYNVSLRHKEAGYVEVIEL